MHLFYLLFFLLAAGCSDDSVTEVPGADAGPLDMQSVELGQDTDIDSPSPQGPEEAVIGGDRLRRAYFESADGTRNSGRLFDTELRTYCRFEEFGAEYRCVPILRSVAYLDDGCTQPLGLFPTTCTDPTASFYTDGDTIYRGLEEMDIGQQTPLYLRTGQGCQRRGLSSTNIRAFELEVVDPNEFVRGTRVVEERTDELEAHFIEGADGSRFLKGAHHAELGYECAFEQGTCFPPSVVVSSRHFADQNCQEPLFRSQDELTYGRILDEKLCAMGNVELLPYTGIVYERNSLGRCNETLADGFYYTPGPPLVPSSLPAARQELEGSGRLAATRVRDAEGNVLSRASFYDRELELECSPGFIDDPSSFRCHPWEIAEYGSRHLDPACATSEEVIADAFCDGPQPVNSKIDVSWLIDGCSPIALRFEQTVRTGEPVTTYALNSSGMCENTDETAYRVDEEVTDELAPLNLNAPEGAD